MANVRLEEIQRDELAMAVAGALALANDAAMEHGIDVPSSLVTIEEEAGPTGRLWRIHYGPRNYLGRRGGDLIVFIDDASGVVQRVIRGQ